MNNLHRMGFTDADVADGGSDRLVDGIVAWGDLSSISTRVQAHHDAGADHVALQVLPRNPRQVPTEQWDALAGALLR